MPHERGRLFGHEQASIAGHSLPVATLERTILDIVDRPRYAGGVVAAARAIASAVPRVNAGQLLDLAARWEESALCQRLGFLIELSQTDPQQAIVPGLMRLVRPGCKVHLGPRREWGTRGRVDARWNVIENVPRTAFGHGEAPAAARGRPRLSRSQPAASDVQAPDDGSMDVFLL